MIFQVEKMHRTNPKELQKIATNWASKAKNVFTLACVLDYIELLLREYVIFRYFQSLFFVPMINIDFDDLPHGSGHSCCPVYAWHWATQPNCVTGWFNCGQWVVHSTRSSNNCFFSLLSTVMMDLVHSCFHIRSYTHRADVVCTCFPHQICQTIAFQAKASKGVASVRSQWPLGTQFPQFMWQVASICSGIVLAGSYFKTHVATCYMIRVEMRVLAQRKHFGCMDHLWNSL